MLEFAFMRKALLAGLLLSIMIPMIGVVMVNRKTSMIETPCPIQPWPELEWA